MPPEHHTNKDWWKALLRDDKKAFKLSQVKTIAVPRIDELSVPKLFGMVKEDLKVKQYLPFAYYEKTKPDRQFFSISSTRSTPSFLNNS